MKHSIKHGRIAAAPSPLWVFAATVELLSIWLDKAYPLKESDLFSVIKCTTTKKKNEAETNERRHCGQ